ncbi:MAG: GNAT family N-acetyltransferase [Clostridia bacterium]|nr:GNAT family N-acetyltransferase [Clostridia bacterium]
MLKKLKSTDIDILMGIWKRAYLNLNKKVNNEDLTRTYTEVRDILMDSSSNTTLYTEDDVIEGFVTVDKNNKIVIIYVDEKIRREGIGSMLVDSCKRSTAKLSVAFKDDGIYKPFFEKNGFIEKEQSESEELVYEWNDSKVERVNLVYFDEDLTEKLIDKTKINVKNIKVKEILDEDKDLKAVKNYMKIRKSIEDSFSKKTLMYLNYGNYNEVLDDIIKEIIKIEKSEFAIVVSEPLIIENPKMEGYLEKIEENFKDYKIHKIDTMKDLPEDVSVNGILEEKMKVIIKQIEKIAENM